MSTIQEAEPECDDCDGDYDFRCDGCGDFFCGVHAEAHAVNRSCPSLAKSAARRPGRYASRQWKRMRHKRGRWLRETPCPACENDMRCGRSRMVNCPACEPPAARRATGGTTKPE